MTRQGTNYYEAWGTSAVVRGDDWVRTARYADDDVRAGAFTTSRGNSGFVGVDDDNNLYAGRDGNVYRRDDDGEWQRNQNGNWSDVQGPTPEQRQQAQERATQSRDRAQQSGGAATARERAGAQSGPASGSPRTTVGDLDRDAYDRSRGRQRVERSRGGGSYGGGRMRGRRR